MSAKLFQVGALYVVPGKALPTVDVRLILHVGAGVMVGASSNALMPGASLVYRGGDLFARLDIDVAFAGQSWIGGNVRIAEGLGYVIGPIAASAGLTEAPGSAIPGVVSASLAARWVSAELQPYAAVVTPVVRESRTETMTAPPALTSVIAGLEYRL